MSTFEDDELEARIRAIVAAEMEARPSLDVEDANTFWLLFGTVVVFFMQAGFALLEASAVKESSVGRTLLKNIFDASFAGLLWWSTGYALAFGSDEFAETGRNGIVGTSGFFYEGTGPLVSSKFAKTHGKAFFSFQWAFAGVAATIVSGAIAGRCTYFAYVCYSCCLTGLVYPVVVHLAWSSDGRFSPFRTQRLMGGCGLIDFAGSGVVHLTGGVAALVAAVVVAPRPGVFDGTSEEPAKYGVVLNTLGTLILWVGWYGFNGVSTLVVANGGAGVAAHAVFNTTIAASSGCVVCTIIGFWLRHYRWRSAKDGSLFADTVLEPKYSTNGILAGLVSVTSGCAVVNAWGALFAGSTGACIYYIVSRLVFNLEIDDVVDAFAVHGACGAWGLIVASLFATRFYYAQAYYEDRAKDCQGYFYRHDNDDGGSTGPAFGFILTVIIWVGGFTTALMCTLKATVGVDITRGGMCFDFDDDEEVEEEPKEEEEEVDSERITPVIAAYKRRLDANRSASDFEGGRVSREIAAEQPIDADGVEGGRDEKTPEEDDDEEAREDVNAPDDNDEEEGRGVMQHQQQRAFQATDIDEDVEGPRKNDENASDVGDEEDEKKGGSSESGADNDSVVDISVVSKKNMTVCS